MISAISWVPKGVSKPVPAVAEPPTQEEIDELIKSGILDKSGGGGSDEDDEGEMEVEETTGEGGQVSQALEVAKALGRAEKVTKSGSKYDDITEGLKELDMDHYDDEDDDGIDLFSGGFGDLYYPSNDMDPYLKKEKDDDEDSEEVRA